MVPDGDEPAPLEAPPGVALADRLMDHQDKIDRAELIERELKLAKAKMGKGDDEHETKSE